MESAIKECQRAARRHLLGLTRSSRVNLLRMGTVQGATARYWALLALAILALMMLGRSIFGAKQPAKRGEAWAPVEYTDLEISTLAYEVAAMMRSYEYPFKGFHDLDLGPRYPSRSLVIVDRGGALPNAFSIAFMARTAGDWKDDITVFTPDGSSDREQSASKCLGIRLISYSKEDAKYRFPFLKTAAEYINFLPLLLPEMREYDILQFISIDAIITGPLEKSNFEDFSEGKAIVFDKSSARMSFAGKYIGNSASSIEELTKNYPGIDNSNSLGVAKLYSVLVQRLDSILETKNKLWETTSSLSKVIHSKELDEPILMLTYWGRWETRNMRSAWNVPIEQLFSEVSKFGVVLTEKTENDDDRYEPERFFSLLIASPFLKCPSIVGHINASTVPRGISSDLMHRAVSQSAIFIRASANSNPILKREKESKHKKRVLVHWATAKYVEDAYSVVLQARTVGQWDEDIILLSDSLTAKQLEALKCLDVKVQIYSPEAFQKAFPWATKNIWHYKLLPFILPSLREYEIIQYLDLDAIVTGPIMKRDESDFEEGVVLLMEDNGYDQSFATREFFDTRMSQGQLASFLKKFPGANEPLNGPNKSPSAGACFWAALVSRMEPPEILLERFKTIAQEYWRYMEFGDQPLLMLAYWGNWRMRYGGGKWRRELHHLFNHKMVHEGTKGVVRYIHTGGALRPPLPTSEYHVIDVFTRELGKELLKCEPLAWSEK